MYNLNSFSLFKDKTHNEFRELPYEKLVRMKKVNYVFIFINKKQIYVKEKNPFFYSCKKIPKKLLQTSLSYIANTKYSIYLLCNLSNEEIRSQSILNTCDLINIRDILFNSEQKYVNHISAAYALYKWQNNQKFCGLCGSKNKFIENGYSAICSNTRCNNKIFPSVFPTIIVNVTHENRILLGRNHGWNRSLYSCLAGFCEQSESAEEAVKREVYEEVGLEVKNIKYKYSQFWPYTSNLMLGYNAEVASRNSKIRINKNEINDAKWFSSNQIKELVYKKKLILPRKGAIAYSLINDWLIKN